MPVASTVCCASPGASPARFTAVMVPPFTSTLRHRHGRGQAAARGAPLGHGHQAGRRGRGPVSYTHLDVYKRQGQEALAYSVKGGHLYVYYKEFACDFERSFVSSRIHSPYKTFVQVEHYPEALAGGDTLMFLSLIHISGA